MELLYSGLKELGLASNQLLYNKLEQYVALIEQYNPVMKLVGAGGDELVIKHILDSLAPLSMIQKLLPKSVNAGLSDLALAFGTASLVDVGSGAGLPGIPLAIALPNTQVTLIDRMTRRINFLHIVKEELKLANVVIMEEQAERAKGKYDIVTFRAFRPFERKLFKKVFALCSPNGHILAYKGKKDKAEAELKEIEGLYSLARIEPVAVPFLPDERCMVIMKP